MGLSNALGMAEAVRDGDITLRSAISWHLSDNCYPAPPPAMVPLCMAAVNAFFEEDYDRVLTLPVGVTWRDEDEVPASAVVSTFHLEGFCP